MLLSLALIFLLGLTLAAFCHALKLPRIIGMMVTGLLLGPHMLNLLAPSLLSIAPDLRQMALIIILVKAGLSVNLPDLKQVGRPAILMSFLPATLEFTAFLLLAPRLFAITSIEAAVMGAVLCAASPAVIVPRMVNLIKEKYGIAKNIPQFILAGTSCDNVFAVLLFTTALTTLETHHLQIADMLHIPLSIFLGILTGLLTGHLLAHFFETTYVHKHYIRNSLKVIILLGLSFLLMAVEALLKNTVPLSGLLAIVTLAAILKLKSTPFVAHRLSEKFGKLWLATELILFVLVGAAIDIPCTIETGLPALLLILVALLFRSLGVLLSLTQTPLNKKEKLFTVIAYLPKATVQAAIGSVPLSLGLPAGPLILSVAILAILITAPLGDIGMAATYQKLLSKEK